MIQSAASIPSSPLPIVVLNLAKHLKVGLTLNNNYSEDGLIHPVVLVSVNKGNYLIVIRKRLDYRTCRRNYGLVLSEAVDDEEDSVIVVVGSIGVSVALHKTKLAGEVVGLVGSESLALHLGESKILLGYGCVVPCYSLILLGYCTPVVVDQIILPVGIAVVCETARERVVVVKRAVEVVAIRRTAHVVVSVVVAVVDAIVAVVPVSPIIVMNAVRREGMNPVAVVVTSVIEESVRTSVIDWRAMARSCSVVTVLVAVLSYRTAGGAVLRRRSIASGYVLRLGA